MKKLILIISILALAIGLILSLSGDNTTTASASQMTLDSKPIQYITLLCLDDRLTKPGQSERDKEIIQLAFEQFEKVAKGHLLINSKDRFLVCIAPQKGNDSNVESFAQSLCFELPKIAAKDRVSTLNDFKTTLSTKIDNLYNAGYRGDQSSLYSGSDIWSFINSTLPTMTNEEYDTKLLVLSDGYFDFEDGKPQLIANNRSTKSEHVFKKFRGNTNVLAEMKAGDFGILKTDKVFPNTTLCIAEIYPKNPDMLEWDILSYIWEDWATECGISINKEHIIQSNIPAVINPSIVGFLRS